MFRFFAGQTVEQVCQFGGFVLVFQRTTGILACLFTLGLLLLHFLDLAPHSGHIIGGQFYGDLAR